MGYGQVCLRKKKQRLLIDPGDINAIVARNGLVLTSVRPGKSR